MPMQTDRRSPCKQAALASDGEATITAVAAAADCWKSCRLDDTLLFSFVFSSSRMGLLILAELFFKDEDVGDGNDQDSTFVGVPMTSSTRKNHCGVKSVFAECIVVVVYVYVYVYVNAIQQMGRIDD